MDTLHWELNVLCRALHYSNLSAAAQNIGLSQPQLSRIVKKLEEALDLTILDRTAKRKSGWLPAAFQLADVYERSERKLNFEIEQIKSKHTLTHLHIGTLEGLGKLANSFSEKLLAQEGVSTIELNIFDVKELEELFNQERLDLIFTFREPGRKKYKHVREFGYQELKKAGQGQIQILSHYEYEKSKYKFRRQKPEKTLISNSLLIRREWIETRMGKGWLPSEIKPPKVNYATDELPVILIGSELLNPSDWDKMKTL